MSERINPVMIQVGRGEVQAAVSGEGPAVLALHGAMGGYDQGLLLAETVLVSRFRVVSVSRPGYLGTSLSIGRTAEEQADVCAAVLSELGVERAVIVAISGGGPTALQFALRHAERCAGLVMISACSARLDVRVPLRWTLMKLMARIPGMAGKMKKRLDEDPEEAIRRAVRDSVLCERLIHDRETAQLMIRLQASVLQDMRQRIAGTDNDIRVTRGKMNWPLEKISAPLLVVHGTKDSMVPYEQATSLVHRVMNSQLLTIQDGEHVSIFTHRAIVRARVDAFLSSIAAYEHEKTLRPELVVR